MKSLKKKIELSKMLESIEIEKNSDQMSVTLDSYHSSPKSHVIGVTGPPGVGKSTLIDKLIRNFRKKKKSVGVIAIDPSSNNSGGALLGDRTRFLLDPNDTNVFVRSMAAKDYLGGISELTFPSMIVMRSKFDYIIIETVGVGQSETSVKDIVDTVILCVQPGGGDTIQFMKSGVFEIPDIITVTKSDMDSLSNLTFSDLLASKSFFERKNDWPISIIQTSSHKNLGFEDLVFEVQNRWNWLKKKERLKKRRFDQDCEWIKKSLLTEFGLNGLRKLKSKFDYKENPFSQLLYLKKKIRG